MKRLPIRGGNWNNAATSGVFALNLNNVRSNANTNIGARPDVRVGVGARVVEVERKHAARRRVVPVATTDREPFQRAALSVGSLMDLIQPPNTHG